MPIPIEWLVVAIVGIVAIVVLLLVYDKKQKRAAYEKMRQKYGKIIERAYEAEELQYVGELFKKNQHKHNNIIDDITWHDLDMDRVFMLLNNTQSAVGQEYLYQLLRTPCSSKEELEKREALYAFLDQNEEVRTKIQVLTSNIGRTKRFSLSKYLELFLQRPQTSNAPHIISNVFIAISIGMMFVNSGIGILCLVGVLIYAVIQYYSEKAKIEPHYVCTAFVVRLISVCKKIATFEDAQLSTYSNQAKELMKPFKKVLSRSKYLGAIDQVNGSLIDLILDYLRIIFHFDLIAFNTIYKQLLNHLDELDQMQALVGELECGIAIASYRRTLPFYCKPTFVAERKDGIVFLDGYHPLIDNPVANSIYETNSVLLTGSNASGKSTFLKTVAINAILAQTIYTVHANEYKTCFYQIYSSMALKDDLENNESYFIVEIKALKRIMDIVNDSLPTLCFVDEVLRGTNTVERIAASSRILKDLAEKNVFCFAATHDIELTHLLTDYYANYHFKEDVLENDVVFNFELNKGRATTRNAIKLLGIIGYPKEVIKAAEKSAEHFVETGIWEL